MNVSSLAVAIGRELQLSRVELAELGGAAMFHDLGYAAVERGASSAGADDSAEWDADRRMRYHPIAGFKALLRQGEYGPGLLRRLLVTLEHHMHFRRPGGYPNLGKKRLSVYTRIVQVADHYDALVTPIDGEPGLLPVQAIERLLSASGVVFDPLAVRALVNVVGRYPYGSLVRLSSKEVGVVTSGGRTENSFLRPRVMVVRNADGSECEPREVDLAENQVIKRRVLEVLDPFTEGVTPHAVLFDQLGADDEDDGSSDSSVDAEAWNKAVWEGDSTSELLEQSAAMPAAEEADPDEAAAEPEPEDAAPVKARPGVPDPDEPTDDLPIATRPNAPAEDSDEAGGGRELTDPAIDPWAFG